MAINKIIAWGLIIPLATIFLYTLTDTFVDPDFKTLVGLVMWVFNIWAAVRLWRCPVQCEKKPVQ